MSTLPYLMIRFSARRIIGYSTVLTEVDIHRLTLPYFRKMAPEQKDSTGALTP